MRIRIVRIPRDRRIDGIQLNQFIPGHQYEVGNILAAVMLCEGWAEPVDDPSPALVIPLDELTAETVATMPRNLTREFCPPSANSSPVLSADRRRGPRHRRPNLSSR
jgi:hypothetical protein